jgi:RNA polymerase sigma-70 factor (ECF subfamily)
MHAEDVVQESFIKAFEKIHMFEGRSSFKTWLFQIAVNTAKNKLRSLPQEHVSIEDVHLGIDPGAETSLVRQDLRRVIRAEVERLPEKQRVALTLRIFEDLSFKEIAQIMQCPYDTAKANYRHGLMRLKERLEELQGQTDFKDFENFFPVEGGRMVSEAEQ